MRRTCKADCQNAENVSISEPSRYRIAADEAHKNYRRSTMSEERLSDLALLSVENKHNRKLDISNLVDIFKQEKARKRII